MNSGKKVLHQIKSKKVLKTVCSVVVLIFSILGLIYYIKGLYERFNVSPDILVNQRYISRDKVPFPAITICSPLKIKTEFLNITKIEEDFDQNITISDHDRMLFASICQSCSSFYKLNMKIKSKPGIDKDFMKIMKKFAPKLNETFEMDKCFTSLDNNCENILSLSLTYAGYCFTFNLLDYDQLFNEEIASDFDVYKTKSGNKSPIWTLEEGYLTDEKFGMPLKSTEAEFLKVRTKIDKTDLPNMCPYYHNLYLIVIHLPNEILSYTHDYTTFNLKAHETTRISASIHELDYSLKKYPFEIRNCYFDGEKQLRFFKYYSMTNCEQECIANFTLSVCGCVFFAAPRSNDMKVCRFDDFPCYRKIYNKWPTLYYEQYSNKIDFPNYPCNCLPTCIEIKYKIISQDNYDNNEFDGEDRLNAQTKIEFTFSQIVETTNYVTYKFDDFIADCGGLAGLFLGFSILSAFEICFNACGYILTKIKKVFQKIKVYPNNNNDRDGYQSDEDKENDIIEPMRIYRQGNLYSEIAFINHESNEYEEAITNNEKFRVKVEDLEKY